MGINNGRTRDNGSPEKRGRKRGEGERVGRIFVYVFGEKVKMDTHEFGGLS